MPSVAALRLAQEIQGYRTISDLDNQVVRDVVCALAKACDEIDEGRASDLLYELYNILGV